MKDENGALQVGANYTTANEELMNIPAVDQKRLVKDRLAQLLGDEITKSFEITTEKPVWMDATVHHVELIVMTPKDYKKLADAAWKYKDLSK